MRQWECSMKKILAVRFALIIGTTMVVISLLNLLIQKDDALKQFRNSSVLVIKQIDAVLQKNEQEIVKKTEVHHLLSRMPVANEMIYYVVDAEEYCVVGATNNKLLGTFMTDFIEGWKLSEVVQSSVSGVESCFYFEKVEDYYIGVSQPKSVVFENQRNNMGQLFVYFFIAAYIMIFVSMRMLERFVIRDVDNIVAGVEEITSGKLETVVHADSTPELKNLSENINQMAGSLIEQNRKISKILDTVDMLIAVYEYSKDSEHVMATGKLGAILMMSEEESREVLKNKLVFEQKINEIKQYPVKEFHKVYQLPVETECYLKIESFRNQQSEFGIIMDVTEEIIDKQRLQRERDYDLLTGLLSRRAFYQKVREIYQKPELLKHSVLMMCDLDGLKQFNDTYGHANGDKAIKKAAEILNVVKDEYTYISRLSGDEFAIIIYGADGDQILQNKINMIYETMMQAGIKVFGKNIKVRLSGGYVFYSKYPEELDQLLKKADLALYESKENGRARFTEYKSK